MNMNARYLIVLAAVFLLQSCEEEKVDPSRGDITGFVKLYDEYGFELADASGVIVTLSDSTTATTNETGRYDLKNVPTGNHKLKFEKEGFTHYMEFEVPVLGGAKPYVPATVSLLQFPSYEIQDLDVYAENMEVFVTGSLTEDVQGDERYGLYFFLSQSESGSDALYTNSYGFCCSETFNIGFSLVGSGFEAGQTVYLRVYSRRLVDDIIFSYYDYDKEMTINNPGKLVHEAVPVVLQ